MNAQETLRELIRESNYSLTEVASELGMKPNALNNKFSYKSMTMESVISVLDVIGYEVAFVPKHKRLPDGCYTVEGKSLS